MINKLKSKIILLVVMVLNVCCVVYFVKIILDELLNFFWFSIFKFWGDIFLLIFLFVLCVLVFCLVLVFCDKLNFLRDICLDCFLIGYCCSV